MGASREEKERFWKLEAELILINGLYRRFNGGGCHISLVMGIVKDKKVNIGLAKINADLYNQSLEKIGSIELNPNIFGVDFNADLVHQAVLAQEANSRIVLAHAKNRAEVRGGGRKPWRQKGTGRARHGSIRSPLWKGGGVTFGPIKERIFAKKINKKMKRKAMFCVLSQKLKDGEMFFLDKISLENFKTKEAARVLVLQIKFRERLLLILPKNDAMMVRVLKNIPRIKTILADSLNTVDLLKHKKILILKEAIPVMEKTYLNV